MLSTAGGKRPSNLQQNPQNCTDPGLTCERVTECSSVLLHYLRSLRSCSENAVPSEQTTCQNRVAGIYVGLSCGSARHFVRMACKRTFADLSSRYMLSMLSVTYDGAA